jgi:hypothetical protein
MSETKHTPGPLYADDIGQIWRKSTWDSYINGGKVAEENPIATAHDGWDAERLEFFPVQANARLIVAAPELLDALERCFNIMNNGGTWSLEDQASARAAIAKAKGEQL